MNKRKIVESWNEERAELTNDINIVSAESGHYLVLSADEIKRYSDSQGNLIYCIEHLL